MKLHRYVDHQRLHIVTKDVISLSISVLLLFWHYISHKITFGAPSSGGVFCSACGAFIFEYALLSRGLAYIVNLDQNLIRVHSVFFHGKSIMKCLCSRCNKQTILGPKNRAA